MRADFGVVLDACVLLPMPLADTLLRMAETPRLYIPHWSEEIMAEVSRNLITKFHKTAEQAAHRERQLKMAFPSAWVDEGYKLLTPCMGNDVKDRHILAAAVRSKSEVIVSYNKRDFSNAALEPFGITCRGPSTFLKDLYDLEPAKTVRKLSEQADNIGMSLEGLLRKLYLQLPAFVDFLCEELCINISTWAKKGAAPKG
jgi:predicted nucleic acid-binding protein